MTIKKNQPIVSLQKIELDYNGETIILNYESQKNNLSKMDAIVRACDESLLSHDGYRRLAAVESCLLREYSIANSRFEITNLINKKIKIYAFNINKNEDSHENLEISEENSESIDNIIVDDAEIGNGVYRSIYTLLQNLIQIWKQSFIINLGDILKLKLSGDGRNVGRKQSHVMLTICLLNEGEEVLKPENQHW